MGRDVRNYVNITSDLYTRSEKVYVLSDSTVNQFFTDLTNGTISGFGVANFFMQTSDYVTKLHYIPIDISKFAYGGLHTGGSIILGNKTLTDYSFDTPVVSGEWLPSIKLFETGTITRTLNNYLDYEPYTKIKIYVPYFETIDLPLELVYGKTVCGYVSLDVRTGRYVLYLYTNDGTVERLFASRETNIAIEVSIGKTNAEEIKRNNVLQSISMIGSVIGLGVGAYSGNPLITAGSVGMLTKNVTQAINNNVNHLTSVKGGNANRTELSVDKHIYLIKEVPQNVRYPNYALKGGVCKKNLSLSGVTGYTEIGEIHFNPSNVEIFDDEINEIIDLLRSGVIL